MEHAADYKKGNRCEDRWFGPFTIVELANTSCLLRNKQRKILKMRIKLSQLKPYLQHEHVILQHDRIFLQIKSPTSQTVCLPLQQVAITLPPPSESKPNFQTVEITLLPPQTRRHSLQLVRVIVIFPQRVGPHSNRSQPHFSFLKKSGPFFNY